MGGEILGPDVGLDLDDPPDTSLALGVGRVAIVRRMDEPRAEQAPGGLERRRRQPRPVERAEVVRGQWALNASMTVCGKMKPKTTNTPGMMLSRKTAAVSDGSMNSQSARSGPNSPLKPPGCTVR